MASPIYDYLCNMKRALLISILCCCASLFVKAQTIDSIFVAVPNAYLPLLEYNSRLDLLDLYNCGMTAKVYNDLGGEACLTAKDSVHFEVQTTASSRFELQVLKWFPDTIYACIRTVSMPEQQSQLVFLNQQWYPLKVKLPQSVSFDHCWCPSGSLSEDRIEELRLALTPAYFHLHWENPSPDTPELVYEVALEGLMPKDREDASKCLRTLRFVWHEGKFIEKQ